MPRVLMIGFENNIHKLLKKELDPESVIEACGTGQWGLSAIGSFKPDVIVVDSRVPDMDPMRLIRTIRFGDRRIGIMLITSLLNEVVCIQAEELRINKLVVKPYRMETIASHIYEIMQALASPETKRWWLEEDVDILLSDLGFRAGPERNRITREVILAVFDGDRDMLMKQAYIEVSAKYKGSIDRIEKALRDAIHSAWLSGNRGIWNTYFPGPAGKTEKSPTNETFVVTIVENLKRRQRRIENRNNQPFDTI